jgi:hypothetical protein
VGLEVFTPDILHKHMLNNKSGVLVQNGCNVLNTNQLTFQSSITEARLYHTKGSGRGTSKDNLF